MPHDSGPLYTTNPDVSLGGPEWRVLEGVRLGDRRELRGGFSWVAVVAATAESRNTDDWGRGRSLVWKAMAALGRPFSGLPLSGSADFLQPPPAFAGRAFPPGAAGHDLAPRPGVRGAPSSPVGRTARGR